jgi:hypothetical protein
MTALSLTPKNFHFCILKAYCRDRLGGGLQKIADASEQLAILNDRLAVQKVAVTEATEDLQSMPIITSVVSSKPAHGEVYSIQPYVIKFVSDLQQACGFLNVLRFPSAKH